MPIMPMPVATSAAGRMRFGYHNTGETVVIAGDSEKEAVVREGKEELERRKRVMGTLQQRLDTSKKPFDYHSDDELWNALESSGGAAKLVSARWLVAYAKQKNATLPRRQEMPPDAFIGVPVLRKMYNNAPKKKDRGPRVPIIACMEFWHEKEKEAAEEEEEDQDEAAAAAAAPAAGTATDASAAADDTPPPPPEFEDCPDPRGLNLQCIARALREHLHIFSSYGFTDVGVFIDRCSHFQPPRALHEISSYKRSQKQMHLWFAHALITTMLCVDVPPEHFPLARRGWNAYASACAWLLKEVCSRAAASMQSAKHAACNLDSVCKTLPATRIQHAQRCSPQRFSSRVALHSVALHSSELWHPVCRSTARIATGHAFWSSASMEPPCQRRALHHPSLAPSLGTEASPTCIGSNPRR